MSTPSRVDTPNTGALGFLSRGIRSVSSFVSTMFSSQAAEVSAHNEPADEPAPATPRASQASDDLAHSGSSSSDDIDTSAPAFDNPTSEDDAHSVSSQEERLVGPDILAAWGLEMASVAGPSNNESLHTRHLSAADAPFALQASSSSMLVVPASSSADLNPDLDNPPRPALSAAAVLYRQRAPLRREGAFYGLSGPSSTANEASTSSASALPPRPRGQLRREPVWHDGEDPSTIAPASELRGRDRRTIPENRYWHPRWGPIPTLRQIHPGPGTPSARDVITWLQQRYDTSSNAFRQAVDHVFPLPDGVDHTSLFARILETSQLRNQDPNWMDGVEPVERVREPARADDAADSDADAESAGYSSDDDAMVEDAEDTTAAPQAGPSSQLAPVPFRSSSCAPSRASSVHSSSATLPASSPGAGPSTQPPGHLKRARDSDGDASGEGRSTPRRRLGLEPQQSPAASSSSTTFRRIIRSASHFARRGASFAPAPVAGPSRPAPAPRAPQITVTPPSRDVSFTLPRPPTEGYLAPGVGRGMRRRRSSSSSSRGSARSSPSSSSSRTILHPPSTAQAAESSTSTPGAGPSSLPGPSSPGRPSGENAQRRHKRRRDEAEDEGRSDDKHPPEDEGFSRKRPKRK